MNFLTNVNSLINVKQDEKQGEISFSWVFKKVYTLHEFSQYNWYITSPPFCLFEYQPYKLNLWGNTLHNANTYELKLELIYEGCRSQLKIPKIKFKFNNSSIELVFVNTITDFSKCFFGHIEICNKDVIAKVLDSSMYDISVKIFCSIDIMLGLSDIQPLDKDFDSLLRSENYADFIIEVGNMHFKTHKCILSCRSKVLAKMIETHMVENQTNKLVLSHWNPNVVKEMLNYVYTGKCDLSIDIVSELFKLAHYLDIAGLQEISKYFMFSNINVNNIADIFELTVSDQYGLADLRKKAMSFISENSSLCVENTKFIDRFCNHLSLDNIVLALKLSKKHALQNLLSSAMEFVRQNYKLAVKNEETRNYLKTEVDLLLQIFENSLDHYSPSQMEGD